ncbi:MAG: hypothetical protein LBI03_00640 [Clostridiales bacterium]|jgi:hypothetical protein|nr:hypothetical protein [Clostridiales bacterium]
MIDEKHIKEISERIKDNSNKIRYGLISVSLKFHEGNLVAISHEVTETTKQKEIIYGHNA